MNDGEPTEPIELGGRPAEYLPDSVELTPRQAIERTAAYFGYTEGEFLDTTFRSARVAEVRLLSIFVLHEHFNISRKDIAKETGRPHVSIQDALSKALKKMSNTPRWHEYYEAIVGEKEPLPLLEQYVNGVCQEFALAPERLQEPGVMRFSRGVRDVLIYRLVQETPVSVRRISEFFNISYNSVLYVVSEVATKLDPDEEITRRTLAAIPDTKPQESSPPSDLVTHVLEITGLAQEQLRDSKYRPSSVAAIRRYLVQALCRTSGLRIPEIAELVGLDEGHVSTLVSELPVDKTPEIPITPERRFQLESAAVTDFFGISVGRYQRTSWPHKILIFSLAHRGLFNVEIGRLTGLDPRPVADAIRLVQERREREPMFDELLTCLEGHRRLPHGVNYTEAVFAVSSLYTGESVKEVPIADRREVINARHWTIHFLRNIAGFKAEEVRRLVGANHVSMSRTHANKMHEHVKDPRNAEVEQFIWRSILGQRFPISADEAVLYFWYEPEEGAFIKIGRVKGTYSEGGGKRLAINFINESKVYHVLESDPRVVDARSARLIMRNPRALDVWLFGTETDPATAQMMKEARNTGISQ